MFDKRSLLFSVLMASMMSVLIGGALTLIKTGSEDFFTAFFETAPIAFGVALPVSIFVTPLMQKLVTAILGPAEPNTNK